MLKVIGRNIFRTIILILAAGFIIGIIYMLSLTSTTTRFSGQNEFPGQGLQKGQSLTPPGGGDFQVSEGEGRYGFGENRGQGQGFGRGLGEGRGFAHEEFSLVHGLAELAIHSITVIALVLLVLFMQRVIKRKQSVSTVV